MVAPYDGFGRDRQRRIENFWLWSFCTTFVLCSQYVLFGRRVLAPSGANFGWWPLYVLGIGPIRTDAKEVRILWLN
jgi:hypothetical protein